MTGFFNRPRFSGLDAPFPLTPTLSLREREKSSTAGVYIGAFWFKRGSQIGLPLPEGEGRGEGEECVRLQRGAQKLRCARSGDCGKPVSA
jgi:hypothetical protein